MLLPVLYLVAAPQSQCTSGLNNSQVRHLHIPAGPRPLYRHGLYLTTTVQFVQVVLLSGGGIARHQPRPQPHMFAVQRSAVIPLIALLRQVLPRNYSSASGATVKHLPEGQGLETMSSKSPV